MVFLTDVVRNCDAFNICPLNSIKNSPASGTWHTTARNLDEAAKSLNEIWILIILWAQFSMQALVLKMILSIMRLYV